MDWTCSHLGRFLARLTVQTAYPSALHHLVVSWVRLHLLPLKCRTVTGFQIGPLHWGFILRWSFDGLHWFHILICLELSPNKNGKHKQRFFLRLQLTKILTLGLLSKLKNLRYGSMLFLQTRILNKHFLLF